MDIQKEITRLHALSERTIARGQDMPTMLIYYLQEGGKIVPNIADLAEIHRKAKSLGVDANKVSNARVMTDFGKHLAKGGHKLVGTVFVADAWGLVVTDEQLKQIGKVPMPSAAENRKQVLIISGRDLEEKEITYTYEVLTSINLESLEGKKELKKVPMIELHTLKGVTLINKHEGKESSGEGKLNQGQNKIVSGFWEGYNNK